MACKYCFNISGAVVHWNTCDSRPLVSIEELSKHCMVPIVTELEYENPDVLDALEVAADVVSRGVVLDKQCLPTLSFSSDCLEALFGNRKIFQSGDGSLENKLEGWLTGNPCNTADTVGNKFPFGTSTSNVGLAGCNPVSNPGTGGTNK